MTSEPKRISTGVSDLDPLLDEGLLIGDNVVWYDDAGSLASVFSMNFLKTSLAKGHPFVYVSFDRSPKNLLEKLGSLAESENLTILDCFTCGKGKGERIFFKFYEETGNRLPCRIINVRHPRDPEAVMSRFLEINDGTKKNVRFVFESLTGMQELWEGEDKISLFYAHTCPKLYELDALGYWIMEKDAHSKRLKASINQIAQVVIELFLKRGKTSLAVIKAENRDIDNLNTPVLFRTKGRHVSFDAGKSGERLFVLGRRLRELRSRRGFSQAQIARAVGVTPSSISQIESSQTYPSLPALYKIAEILSVDVSTFFHDSPETGNRIVFPAKTAVDITLPDMPGRSVSAKLLTSLDAAAKAEPYLIEITAGQTLSSHFFSHKGEEFGYLLSGELRMKTEKAAYRLTPGDTIYLTADVPSRWTNSGTDNARLLWLIIR